MTTIKIRPLVASPDTLRMLTDILVETVAAGGSVSFMHPLSLEKARAFWQGSLASAALGERVVFGAFDGDSLVGTTTLVTGLPENQPHRAEIAKMMVALRYRGQGIACALLRAAEAEAAAQGRTHLMLDTATDGGAAGLYERQGFVFAGEIPDYALKPQGGLTGTRLYWKRIG
ncbi:GNAT family N-acetyltransferase [Acidisoma cellulosilytica]|uniref:GNAT family N-acetyltransferase n=1 Tax=Acidisoma cellulosilyticum TaxID=2802395 RepID=A0A963YZ46_9PROT|nr:GNAT family N-acetyltransferase [Acidisoma cellulosilyticum]MCB8879534.1 GNAT family N-acetyltransferase [Acidisoma cellulosilyticum]